MTETPAISWGYWKARNMPALARTSVGQSVMSSPWKKMRPPVTSYSGLARRVLASVDLPEPFGPMMAWTSPGRTTRSTPFRRSAGGLDRAGPEPLDPEQLGDRWSCSLTPTV